MSTGHVVTHEEHSVVVDGRRVTVVTTAMPSAGSTAPTSGDDDGCGNPPFILAAPASSSASAVLLLFRCQLCDASFPTDDALRAHRESKGHKLRAAMSATKAAGPVKADHDVTIDDLRQLVERKRMEKGIIPFSELRFRPKRPRD